jgi:threonyl-tRNA synthetase
MRVELSLRPDNKLGTDEEWDFAEEELRKALATRGLEYVESDGEGSFYGPKIDIHMNDSLGRSWQLGTVQLDLQMPKRFGLTYAGDDNTEHTPAMIHRALLGSLERFIGIYLEHTGGELPVWLAPEQVRVIPVAEDYAVAAAAVAEELREQGVRVGVDERTETLGRRIRDAELAKVPYVVVWGDRESRDALAVRRHHGEQSTLSLDALAGEIADAGRL